MKVHQGLDNISTIKNAVVTTGSFDGVHVGHKVIINRLKMLAAEAKGESVLITFWPHPRKVLYPDTKGKDLKMISSQKEKIRVLKETGLDHLVIIPFTKAFSQLSSHQFIVDILVKKLHAKVVVVGFNHYFGHNREGNFDALRQLGRQYNFSVEEIPEQDIQNETVSSTKIRAAVQTGDIQRANAYLNHIYTIIGPQRPCQHSHFSGGIHTCDLLIEEEEKLLPPPGAYAIRAQWTINSVQGVAFHTPDNDGNQPHLCFTLFTDQRPERNQEVTLGFHKKLKGADLFHNGKPGAEALEQVLKQAKELIY